MRTKFCIAMTMVIATLAFSANTAQAALADIVFVVDESGSMSGEHAWLGGMVGSLDTALVAAGSTSNQYGLLGFGGSSSHLNPHKHAVGGGDLGTAAQFSAATSSLVITGNTEDGWRGIEYAMNNYSFRAGAAINIVLVTDEDRDNTDNSVTYATALASLTGQSALLNVVVNNPFSDDVGSGSLGVDGVVAGSLSYRADGSGGFTTATGPIVGNGSGSTEADYVPMAFATGGAAWDLNKLRLGGLTAQSFTAAFVAIKVEEISQQQQVPEPSSLIVWSVIGLCGIGFGWRRRRKAA